MNKTQALALLRTSTPPRHYRRGHLPPKRYRRGRSFCPTVAAVSLQMGFIPNVTALARTTPKVTAKAAYRPDITVAFLQMESIPHVTAKKVDYCPKHYSGFSSNGSHFERYRSPHSKSYCGFVRLIRTSLPYGPLKKQSNPSS